MFEIKQPSHIIIGKYSSKQFDFNENCLIIEFFENDGNKPSTTNLDFLESIIKIHTITNNLFGFEFNTQIGAI